MKGTSQQVNGHVRFPCMHSHESHRLWASDHPVLFRHSYRHVNISQTDVQFRNFFLIFDCAVCKFRILKLARLGRLCPLGGGRNEGLRGLWIQMECEALKSQSGSATLLCLIGDGFIFYNAYASGLCQKNISSISALVVENEAIELVMESKQNGQTNLVLRIPPSILHRI